MCGPERVRRRDARLQAWEKQISLLQRSYFLWTTFQKMLSVKKSSCICSFFAHALLLKAGPGLQYILNIITVAGSTDAMADADPKF